MEFFHKEHAQGIIDEYMKGQMDETTFLEKIRLGQNMGFSLYFYRPLIFEIREKKGALLALNVPHEIVRKVARTGLAGLNEEERGQVAREIDLNNEEHKAYMEEVLGEHFHHGIQHFESFYEANAFGMKPWRKP